jgi:hypothetical protein
MTVLESSRSEQRAHWLPAMKGPLVEFCVEMAKTSAAELSPGIYTEALHRPDP